MRWLRSCARCGSLRVPIDLFCDQCWVGLLGLCDQGIAIERRGYPFPVRALLEWTDETDSYVRPFVYAQKNGRAYRAIEQLTLRLSCELGRYRHERLILIYPTTHTRPRVHAWLIANLIGFCDADRIALFASDKQKASQKTKSLGDRSRIRFQVPQRAPNSENFSLLKPLPARVIFVDDIITSGATALAAYIAAGEPEGFEVWTLVCRTRKQLS